MHQFSADVADMPVQVVQARIGQPLMAIFEALQKTDREAGNEASALVVRLPVDGQVDPATFTDPTHAEVLERLLYDQGPVARERVFGRVRDRSVHVLHSHEGDLHLSGNVNPHFPGDPLAETGLSAPALLEALREAELDHIVERSRALLSSPPGAVFRAPSGHLVEHFLRVGNIQCDRDAIDSIFFWLLPNLKRVAAILTDTWSISSIAFNVAGLTSTYFGGAPRRVEMLPGYHDGSKEASARASEIIQRLADDCPPDADRDEVLVLISATQSGSLATNLGASFEGLSDILKPRYIAIFALGPTGLLALRNLSDDGHYVFRPTNSETLSEPVVIDPQVYFPLQFQDIPFSLNKAEAERYRAFFDRYADTGLVSVHRDDDRDPAQPRHHAIHLDLERIIEHKEFAQRLDAVVERLPRPILMVAPPHPAAQQLAEAVAERLDAGGRGSMLLAHPNLYFGGLLTEEQQAARRIIHEASEDDDILIIDDMCVNAASLSQFQKYLRTEQYRGRINYVVGIQRMPDPAAWKAFARRLSNRGSDLTPHAVHCLEEVPLPDARAADCPWCREVRLLDRWSGNAPLPPALLQRRERLAASSSPGLSEDIFLTAPNVGPLKLGPDSFYVRQESTEADAYAATAAVIQSLRVERRKDRPVLGRRRFPVATVLRWEDYLTEKWTDSILRATILRAGEVDELAFTALDEEGRRRDALRDLMGSHTPGEHDVTLEILLAAGLGKARIIIEPALEAAMECRPDAELAIYMLGRLAEDQSTGRG